MENCRVRCTVAPCGLMEKLHCRVCLKKEHTHGKMVPFTEKIYDSYDMHWILGCPIIFKETHMNLKRWALVTRLPPPKTRGRADTQRQGQEEFRACCRLVGHCQAWSLHDEQAQKLPQLCSPDLLKFSLISLWLMHGLGIPIPMEILLFKTPPGNTIDSCNVQ